MAANAQSLLLILLVCVLCYARQADAANSTTAAPRTITHHVATSTAAPQTTKANKTCWIETTSCKTRMQFDMRKTNGLPLSSVCRFWANWETCLLEAKQYCSYADWSDISDTEITHFNGGYDLDRNMEEHCCKPLDYCDEHDFKAAAVRFEHTEKQCNATEDFWMCSRRVVNIMSDRCHFLPALDLVKSFRSDAEMMLNKCYRHGYYGKHGGHFHGAAGSFQGHPLMTLVATVSAILLGVNRFQL